MKEIKNPTSEIINYKEMSKKADFSASIKSLNAEELQARIKEDELRLQKVTFAHSVTPLENPQSIKTLRRDIARVKTALRSKELGLS
jgi:large subunit ribosomal protein L29